MRKEIEKIAKEFNLINEGERHFWSVYNSYRGEEAEEHNTKIGNNEISILPVMIAYKLLVQNNNEVVEVKFDVLSNESVIGYYSLIMDYDTRKFIDDYFVLY